MRNILVTAMMIIVVVLLFVSVISDSGGIMDSIGSKGRDANQDITSVQIQLNP